MIKEKAMSTKIKKVKNENIAKTEVIGCARIPVDENLTRETIQGCVAIYKRDFSEWLNVHVLDKFRKLSYDKAVEYAGLALLPPELKVYTHERRLSRAAREKFAKGLLAVKEDFRKMASFEEIMETVQEIGRGIKGIGDGLAAYDAALRIAVKLDKLPQEYVYAFRGATISESGAKRNRFARSEFRQELDKLTAYEIEDFLCIFHKERGEGKFTVLKYRHKNE